MDISLELKGLPCLNKVYLLTYLLSSTSGCQTEFYVARYLEIYFRFVSTQYKHLRNCSVISNKCYKLHVKSTVAFL